MPRAFLSHSTADDRYVAELESFLRASGLEVFNDIHSIQLDEQFWPKIREGIAGSDALIVVITNATRTSRWVTREVEYARSLKRKVIPLWVEDCALPALFAERDVIDLRPRSRALVRTVKAFAASPAGAFEKGQRLARLVGQRRSLLILDGLEPLQYAPTSPTPGELKDQGIAALLRALAAASHGLCVVTTRYSLPDLKAFWQTTAPEVKLLRLSRDAGVHLLKTLGVTGTAKEFESLVEDVKGHALTLTLLGGFLKRAFHGDIRQRDRVKFEKADEKMDGGHAFHVMDAYVNWLEQEATEKTEMKTSVSSVSSVQKANVLWPCCGSWDCSTGPPTPAASRPCEAKPSPASPNRSPGWPTTIGNSASAASKPRSCSR